jgi:TPR repeat protein
MTKIPERWFQDHWKRSGRATTARGKKFIRHTPVLLLFIFLTGCNQEKAGPPNASSDTAKQKSQALQQWRQNRALARARSQSERALADSPTPSPQKTNVIDSAKALKTLGGFSDRLKNIIGEPVPAANEVVKNAEKGDAVAQAELAATFWAQGDFASAFKWNSKAAEQGNVRAERALGMTYISGQGADPDFGKAIQWFKKAAEKGDMDSQYSLALRYVRGDHVEQNFAEAAKWLGLAANQGQPDSQVSLARRYANGEGVQKDVVEAYKWVLIAGDYWSAGGVRDDLAKNMTPEQIADAKKRADEFKPARTISQ